ncbi:MAG TPA: FxsA family protein [Gammaproteobacteria bacterium]|nr:FxsA family protein [Gammaproteobacteria bacterium]
MDLRIFIFLLFIGLPLLEIYLLIEAGSAIGAIPVIFIIVFTGVLGALLLKHQGTYSLSRIRKSMERGEIPAMAMFESVFIFAAAILLLVPGLITDTLGIFFLITPLRRLMIGKVMGLSRFTTVATHTQKPPDDDDTPPSSRVIDGECKRED